MTSLLHLTDCHIVAEGALLHGSIDTLDHLRRALAAVEATGVPVDAIVLSGDLADTGAPQEYRQLREVVEPSAGRLGARVVYAMGNHDERAAFQAELLDDPSAGHLSYDVVHHVGGLRIVVLDSTVPGHPHGEITDEQYAWLESELACPATEGTVLVVHHPPTPAPDVLHTVVGLREPDRLIRALAGTDVRIVLGGHTHAAAASTVHGTFVWVGGALAYALDVAAPAGMMRGRPGPSFSRIDLREGTVTALAIALPAQDEQPVYEVTDEQVAAWVDVHTGAR